MIREGTLSSSQLTCYDDQVFPRSDGAIPCPGRYKSCDAIGPPALRKGIFHYIRKHRVVPPPHAVDAGGGQALQQTAEGFRFLTVPDGLPAEHGRLDDFVNYSIALDNLAPILEKRILAMTRSEDVPPITCIITDSYMTCTYQLALNLHVPRVVFWTMCAALSVSQFKAELLLSKGHIPVKCMYSVILLSNCIYRYIICLYKKLLLSV